MRVPVNWLKELVETKKTPQELADLLVSRGLGVESILRVGERLEDTIVAEVVELNSGNITISTGKENYSINNSGYGLKINDKVVFDPQTKQLLTRRELGFEDNAMVVLPEGASKGEKTLIYLDDYVFDFEIAPNRGDLMGVIGIARELACFEEKELNLPTVTITESEIPISNQFSLEVIDTQGCPDYIARLILAVKITPAPFWLQWRLIACGLRPVNNVVDISNYILFKYGQPLHTFDYDKLTGKKLLVRCAEKGEKIKTIDGIERNLNDSVLMIADTKRGVAIAGIMGGIDTEISLATRNVLLECARFNPVVIRKGSQFLKLATEASKRFEMGIDADNLENAAGEAVAMMNDLAQGKVAQGKVEFRTPMVKRTARLAPMRVNNLLGSKLSRKKTKQILTSLGFKLKDIDTDWEVQIPSFRPDVQCDADLIEEIGRVYGYHHLPSRFDLRGIEPGRRNPVTRDADKIREVLTGYGFNEVYTVSFTDETTARLFFDGTLIKIPNPLNERFSVLRPLLLPTILEVVNLNLRRGNKDLRLFEIGKVYRADQENKETIRLGGIMTGNEFPIHWASRSTAVNYYDLKAVLEILFKAGRLEEISYVHKAREFLQAQDATAIYHRTEEIGFVGTLNQKIAEHYELAQAVLVFELDLTKIGRLTGRERFFKPLPRFPGIARDFALVLDETIPAAEVEKRIWQYGGELLASIEIFDCFSGGSLESGKKNLGVRLLLRVATRTLSDEEANQNFDRILTGLKQDLKVTLRRE